MSVLKLAVISGLGSRMRPVVGGIAYTEATGRELVVVWPLYDHSEQSGLFPARMSDIWIHPYTEDNNSAYSGTPKGNLRDKGDVSYRSNSFEEFLPWMSEHISHYADRLKPTKAVEDIIGGIMPLPRPTVGVHIRYSLKADKSADVDWYIQRLSTFPQDCQFFLSCDHRQVSERIHRAFPGRILELKKDYAYDKPGILKAAADMYILRDCDWVVGANHSSYSQMVALLRGATYRGTHEQPNGISGGRYEDLANPATYH